MARIVTVSVGPLNSAVVNQVVQTQKVAGATFMVLNGAAGVSSANNIALSQTVSSATTVVLNGSLAQTIAGVTTANIGASFNNSYIFITSAGNDSGITFTVVGQQVVPSGGLIGVTEVITGANASTVSSTKQYSVINSITTSNATAGAITVGTWGPATLDKARQILFTSAGNDTGITATISGTDINGTPISETVTLGNPTATSVLDYLTVNTIKTSGAVATTIQVGTNGVAHSAWVRFDEYSGMGPTSIQVDGTGTVNWTVQQTLDDPVQFASTFTLSGMNWVQHPDAALQGSAVITGVQGNYAYPPVYARLQLNSGSGSAKATFTQSYMK